MGKVIFTVSYDIIPEKRDEYLALTREMKATLSQNIRGSYSVFEQKGKKNSFSEVFIFDTTADYDQLEDQDEQTAAYMSRLQGLLVNGKMKYSTIVEVA
jgi:antibiotic biosynthesis monooxygenase (ABM) superfamily enzyme